MKEIICPRCTGHGIIQKYNHIEGGRCFQCEGSGKIFVDDNTIDIIREIKEYKRLQSQVEKEFNDLWEQLKEEIKINKDWYNYILCEGTELTTKDEERIIRIKQYIDFKRIWKEYIKNHMELIDDMNNYYNIKNEFENKYLYTRD